MNRRTFIKQATTIAGAALGASIFEASAESRMTPGKITKVEVIRLKLRGEDEVTFFLEITAEDGQRGHAGPLYETQAAAIMQGFPPLILGRDLFDPELPMGEALWEALHPGKFHLYTEGKDPLTGASIWGTRRNGRHTASGAIIQAASAIDLALWDLRGKVKGQPVFRLLGSQRQKIAVYASMHSYSDDPTEAAKSARDLYDQGFHRQKWFFNYGPKDGAEGRLKNVRRVHALREELGSEARLMFDAAFRFWDADYAVAMARDIAECKPTWLEEPLVPEDIEGFTRLRGETGIPIAGCEHFYTRWNLLPFLKRKIFDYVQLDPEWCGGLTEHLKVCATLRDYPGVQFLPHGHHVLAQSQAVAVSPEEQCPLVEWLMHHHAATMQRFQKTTLRPEAGYLTLSAEAGLGPGLDEAKFQRLL